MNHYPLGMNVDQQGWATSAWIMADILQLASNQGFPHVQTTLTQARPAGQGYFVVADSSVFTGPVALPGAAVQSLYFANIAGGSRQFTGRAVAGSPYLQIVSWSNPTNDISYPAGTPISAGGNGSYGWTNLDFGAVNQVLAPEYLDTNSRPTGFPAGLKTNQGFYPQIIWGSNYPVPIGAYTVIADGTGTLTYTNNVYPTGSSAGTVSIVGGVATPATICGSPPGFPSNIKVTASSPTDPLRNLRIIVPDRPGRSDGIAAGFLANRSNPYYFRYHPDYVDGLEQFQILRFADAANIDFGNTDSTWNTRPINNGAHYGVYNNRVPWEWMIELCNEAGCDGWFNVPITILDDYATGLATLLLQQMDPTLKVAVELGNEVWNPGIGGGAGFAKHQGVARQFSPWAVNSITYSAGTCTVTTARAHGFATGNVIQIANATDDTYNGPWTITVTGTTTFTYATTATPTNSTATAIPYHHIMALNTTSTLGVVISSMSWDGEATVTVNTATPHNYVNYDIVQIANASDDGFNGIYGIYINNPTQFHYLYNGADGFTRPIPQPAWPKRVTATPRAGMSLQCWLVGDQSGKTAAPNPSGIGQTWYAYQVAHIHTLFHQVWDAAGQAGRLILTLTWQVPGPGGWLDRYIAGLNNNNLPLSSSETAIACAPYFLLNRSQPESVYFGELLGFTSLTQTGGVATAVTSAKVTVGQTIGVYNAAQAGYCGLVTVTGVAGAGTQGTTWTYAVDPATPATATVANQNILGGKMYWSRTLAYLREVTAITLSGTTATCISTGHGFTTGQQIYMSNLPTQRFNPVNVLAGLQTVTVIDVNTFSYTFTPGFSWVPQPNNRAWAYSAAAIQGLMGDMQSGANAVLAQMPAFQQTATKYPGLTLRCYESGQSMLLGSSQQSNPGYADMVRQTVNSDQMGQLYTSYYNTLCGTYGILPNHYSHIGTYGTYGAWGIKEYQYQLEPPRYYALRQIMPRPKRNLTAAAAGPIVVAARPAPFSLEGTQ